MASSGGKGGPRSGSPEKSRPISNQPENGGNWPTRKPGRGPSGGNRGNAVQPMDKST